MKVISVIEDEEIIKKILKHLGLWEIKARPPPRVTGSPKIQEYKIDYSASQLPVSDKWLCVDPEYREGYPRLIFQIGLRFGEEASSGEMYNLFSRICRPFHEYMATALPSPPLNAFPSSI